MVIITGTFTVDPAQRDAFLAQHEQGMRASRGEDGCLEYCFAADPLEPGRVILSERWRDQAALDAHLVALRSRPRPEGEQVAPTSALVDVHQVASTTKLA